MLRRIRGTMLVRYDALLGTSPCPNATSSTSWRAGATNDLARRLMQHRAKAVPGFTRRYGVDKLAYFEEYPSILEARAREGTLKRWRRAWKIALIEEHNPQWRDLADELVML